MINQGIILIVDDDTDITLLLKNGLEDNGYFADSYNDPRLALKDFRADYYDLLVDIRMPNMNGFEFYHEVRKSDIKIKLCFLTVFPISFEEIRKVLPPELIQPTEYHTKNLLQLQNLPRE